MGLRPFVVAIALAVAGAAASPASAQDSSWGDVGFSFAHVDYDLSGTGSTPAVSARITRDLSPNVALEFRGLVAKPDQQFGPSTLIVPEAQLQYRWNFARVSPYVGGGIGLAVVRSAFHDEVDPALSAAAGAHIRLSERVGLIGEMRLRGVEWRFTGTVAEWSAGLAWRFF